MSIVELKFGKNLKKYKVGDVVSIAKNDPITLSSGNIFSNIPVAFQTYGKLNKEKSNAILICHALTGDQYAASKNPITNKDGWWDFMIGKNKPINTNDYFVICINVLGGCLGSLGPNLIDPKTSKLYNLDFPVITISDMVKIQYSFLKEHFKLEKIAGVIGGSMGGMQVLEWVAKYPKFINFAIPIATSARHTSQNIAFHEVGRQAIMADPNWCQGNYIANKKFPEKGLAVARMTAHITYMSEASLANKFGRNLQNKKLLSFDFNIDFQVESYLHHQGICFVDRFDPNSYLYITKAMDYFDLVEEYDNNLSNAFMNAQNVKLCVIGFSDDWLFPANELKLITQAAMIAGLNVTSLTIESNKGHDSFLIPNDNFEKVIKNFVTANNEN